MNKHGLWALLVSAALALTMIAGAGAEIIPPQGEGQVGYQAVVLCNSLSVRETQSTRAKAVKSLRFGDTFVTQNVVGGWAAVFQSEEEGPIGYVLSDYIAVDPAWYQCEGSTAVYAWGDESAPKVALLDRGTKLPLLKDMGDWLVIGLRGASGWVKKTEKDRAATTPSLPPIGELTRADLITNRGVFTLTTATGLSWIRQSFSAADAIAEPSCPFNATLILYQRDGQTLVFSPATDGCPYFRTMDGQCLAYGNRDAALRLYGTTSGIARQFYAWFGLSVDDLNGETGAGNSW